ncbi:calcyphosin-2-like [Amphiura filiformis]|uniref:calcyphosin-2-like n=1 Tax=Amphiura filiformis TaxID=82378 RepID=UPI003B21E57E
MLSTPDAPREGAKPASGGKQCQKRQVGVITESHLNQVQTTFDIKPRIIRMQHPRPQGVPVLDLGALADKEDNLRNPIAGYEQKLDPPDTASTVSWGYHDYTPGAGRSSSLNAPFALHHTPNSAVNRNQTRSHRVASPLHGGTKTKPKSAWNDPVVPENLPPPSERQKQQFKQCENDMKQQYQQQSQRHGQHQKEEPAKANKSETIDKSEPPVEDDDPLSNSWSNPYSIQHQAKKSQAEEKLEARKRQEIMETVMVDQLSRSVISDPEQNQDVPLSSNRGTGLFTTSKPRNLHHSKVKTSGTATEKLLSKRLSFSGRVLARGIDALRELCGFYFALDNTMTIYEYRQFGKKSSALPFIQRGSYSHVGGRRKGKPYVVQDMSVGRDLTFETSQQPTLPPFLKKSPIVSIRVTDVDESAKEELVFQGNVPYNHEEYQRRMAPPVSKQEHEDMKLLAQIQGKIHNQLKKRAAKTLIGLGLHFSQLDRSGDGVLSRIELKEALSTYHINIEQLLFDKLWDILDQNGDGAIDYAEFRRAFVGEMNEYRKGYVRKVFHKVDSNKSGTISKDEIKKFYCVQKHPKVVQGLATPAEVLEEFLQLFEGRNKEISFGEFDDYFEGTSIMTKHDDDFVNMLKSCWGL